jgi:two-component system nitrogen regulation response regulator GlnG
MAAALLFGHARGAFTGALQKSPGYYGEAEGGTLFLDEVGEVSRDVQALLLRAVREREVQPVGETKAQKVDVRLLTATDADLESKAASGEFSLALLRRLEAYTLRVPPLRQRRDDIARLFFHFLRAQLEGLGEGAKLEERAADRKPWLPLELLRALVTYPWPGNVGELQACALRVAVSNRGQSRFVLDEWLAARVGLIDVLARGKSEVPAADTGQQTKLRAELPTDVEIVRAMRESGFKVLAAASALGVSRSYLHTRLQLCDGIRQAKDLTREQILAEVGSANGSTRRLAEMLEVSEHGLKLRLKALGVIL